MLEAAAALENSGYLVYFAWENLEQITSLTKMLGITLQDPRVDITVLPLYFGHNPLKMWAASKRYDLVFYMSDGSIPLLGATRNFLHMQVPFHGVGGRSLQNKLKNLLIDGVIVNSRFTKSIVDKEYGISSRVIYPPVTEVEAGVKEKIILSVGRFEPSLNVKKQDKMIEAFNLLSHDLPDWSLILAGASSSQAYVTALSEQASQGVTIIPNASYEELQKLYSRASIYWHAAGLGVDPVKNPELTEHFGITTAEAISAGCIPLVVPYGGQTEVVTSPDFYFESVDELVELTRKIVRDLAGYRGMATGLMVNQFAAENFRKNIVGTLK